MDTCPSAQEPSVAGTMQASPAPGAWATTCKCAGKCDATCVDDPTGQLTAEQRRHIRSAQMDGVANMDEETIWKVREGNVAKLLGCIREHCGAGLEMLDIGSGTGDYAVYCAREVGAESVKCYDVVLPEDNNQSVGAIQVQAKQKKQAVEVNLFDGLSIPEPDASFDAVSAIFVLHHAGPKCQMPLLRDMIRVSKQYIVITEDLNEPPFVERNEMHDINGLFRTDAEWLALWQELELDVLAAGSCNAPGTPQQYYLLKKKR